MNRPWGQELRRTTALTFEELGFLLPTPGLDDEQRAVDTDAGVYVDFDGPFSGRVVLRTSRRLLPTLAANMLGQEMVPSAEQQRDALGEIANVICGNLLPQIAGTVAVFHIQPPGFFNSVDGPPTPLGELAAEALVGLDIGRADVQLFVAERSATDASRVRANA